jgi:hypothetical protein
MSELERKLVKLDEELHSILRIMRKKSRRGIADSTAGAWGYEVDSKDFVKKLRKSKRLSWTK